MDIQKHRSTSQIRTLFTQEMSAMYQTEVPEYKRLLNLVNQINNHVLENNKNNVSAEQLNTLSIERHGAIRVGTAEELYNLRRLFLVMGMHPVDYYDLSIAGIPVHSTAFRALAQEDINTSPFRVFTSLLRLNLIKDSTLRDQAENILFKRNLFPEQLLKLIETSEIEGRLNEKQANDFVKYTLNIFRWHKQASVDKNTYKHLKESHGLVADIVSFKGPHINHLTPTVLDIDACQVQFSINGFRAKTEIEGPPKRNCPILLRQTSFLALEENIDFIGGDSGTHTARFGEVEQRGVALTPKGRRLYDNLLKKARDQAGDYARNLKEAFMAFPDTHAELREQSLAYYHYSFSPSSSKRDISGDLQTLINQGDVIFEPIIYEDFLPVSAAGIFTSNLVNSGTHHDEKETVEAITLKNTNQQTFESALGCKVVNSFDLYENIQEKSLERIHQSISSI